MCQFLNAGLEGGLFGLIVKQGDADIAVSKTFLLLNNCHMIYLLKMKTMKSCLIGCIYFSSKGSSVLD